jgi:hypothetical protein
MTKHMVMVYINIKMGVDMKVIGQRINIMVVVVKLGLMEANMKANMYKGRNVDKEVIFGLMVVNMKENGKIII